MVFVFDIGWYLFVVLLIEILKKCFGFIKVNLWFEKLLGIIFIVLVVCVVIIL